MWCVLSSGCFLLMNLCLAIPIITHKEFDHDQSMDQKKDNLVNFNLSSIQNDVSMWNSCAIQSINIDQSVNETDFHRSNSSKMILDDAIRFTSTWKREIMTNQITFTIPYEISQESILNKTILIIDVTHNQLLASLTDFCYNESSFVLNYSTIQPLPHNICLYLSVNLTSSMTLRDIIFCRTIEDSDNNSSEENLAETTHAVGPSGFFILSQCIIILIMMFVIYGVQTAREKSLINRVSERLVRSRPYITIFGNKPIVRTSNATTNSILNPATTLQAGLNYTTFHHRLASVIPPIEEQVLAANDLTTTLTDRRATRYSINRDFINVKEFTKRLSVSKESSTDVELYPV